MLKGKKNEGEIEREKQDRGHQGRKKVNKNIRQKILSRTTNLISDEPDLHLLLQSQFDVIRRTCMEKSFFNVIEKVSVL